jgi:hypothetical protein
MDTTTLIVIAAGLAGLGIIWWMREHADPDPVDVKAQMQAVKAQKLAAALAKR